MSNDHSLLASLSLYGAKDGPITIIGPEGIKEYIETSIRLSVIYLTYKINVSNQTNSKNLLKFFRIGYVNLFYCVDHRVYKIKRNYNNLYL